MTYFKHWTTSSIKGCQEFNDIELLKLWQTALYKGYFNESNWVKKRAGAYQDVFDVDYKSPWGLFPLFVATNRMAVIVVNVGTDSGFSFPDIKLTAFDPNTNDVITATAYQGKSATPIEMGYSNGNLKYLSWAYCVLKFTGGETYTNDDGFLTKQRANFSLEYGDGGKYSTFDESVSSNYFIKFIEMGNGFSSEILPTFNQPIPDNFLTAFLGMINGMMKTYGDPTGLRHTNYLIPSPIRQINISNSDFLKNLILKNDMNSSLTSNNYYSTAKLVTTGNVDYNNSLIGDISLTAGYVINGNGTSARFKSKTDANVSYTNWKEFNLIGDDYGKYRNDIYFMTKTPVSLILNDESAIYRENDASSPPISREFINYEIVRNLASPSSLPGYVETLLTNLYEFYRTPLTSTKKPALNNVYLSIIKSTFELPFWKYPVNNDVVEIARVTEIRQNDDFDMYLKIESDTTEDIIDNDVNLFVKFII